MASQSDNQSSARGLRSHVRGWIVLALLPALLAGCSVRKMAVDQLGDALSGSGSAYARDDDPELIRDAAPFSLKLMETVLAETPGHEGLLLALTSGFAQYAYAFVQQPAERLEATDFERSQQLTGRARKLYRRARDYGLRALELRHPGWRQGLHNQPAATVARCGKGDVPLLYWTGLAWAALIAQSKDDPETIADLPDVAAMMDRALALDPDYDAGALHSFYIAFTFARADKPPDSRAVARAHFDRAMALGGGQNAGPLLAWATEVSVQEQNVAEFKALLGQALAVKVDARPEWTLMNSILQERARWLLSRVDDLFVPALPPEPAK